jgi:nucleotide-binding universal stress UspA family protein
MSDPGHAAVASGAPLLIAYDGSEGARRAIDVAMSVFPEHEAVVLAVAAPVTVGEALAESFGAVQSYEELNESVALETAAEGAARANRAGLIARGRAEIAVPTWQGILDVADELGAAAIVVGSRALRGPREMLEGSVSHEVAKHAHRPVVIVPPPRT